jgi:hypothetical protein
LDVHFSEIDGTSTPGPSILAGAPRPAVGLLTPVAQSDGSFAGSPSLTLDLSNGLGVFTGSSDRTLTPVVYASVAFPTGGEKQRDHVLPFLIPNNPPMTDQAPTTTALFIYNGNRVATVIPPFPLPVSLDTWVDTLAGPAIAARFDKMNACDQLAVPLNGPLAGGHVRIYGAAPCLPVTPMVDVKVPGPVCSTCAGPVLHAVDVDFDGNLDLVVTGALPAQTNQGAPIYVAYGDGAGHFSATPGGAPNGMASAALGPVGSDGKALPNGAPLAVGDLNGDCVIDLVDSGNIYLSYPVPSPLPTCTPHVVQTAAQYVSYTDTDAAHAWSQGVIADMNGDGRPDVVVSSSVSAGITVYRGTPAPLLLNPVSIVTSTPVKSFVVADFDGDLINDVALVQTGDVDPATGSPRDQVLVSFGAVSGPPTDPAGIGEIAGIAELHATLEAAVYPDLVYDPVVLAYQDTATTSTADLYLFEGNSARQIGAPYLLIEGGLVGVGPMGAQAGLDAPRRSVIGSFTGRAGFGDVAVFAKPFLGCEHASCMSLLWILPTTGGGVVSPSGSMDNPSKPYPLPPLQAGADDVLLANIGPSAGSRFDEVAIAAPDKGSTAIVTVGDAGGDFTTLGVSFVLTQFDVTDVSGVAGEMFTADVDGDGHRDLVLSSPTSGLAVVFAHPTGPAFDAASATATLPLATFTLAACAAVPSAPRNALGAVAMPASGGSEAQPILVVVPHGAQMVRWDAAKKTLVSTCASGLAGGIAVATGDFNGDRILDVVVSEANALEVFYGDAVPVGGVDGGAK